MNYRHAFHAGNFADLVKHAALLAALRLLQRDAAPLHVIDTHGGAGRYRIDRKAPGEAVAAQRLLADGAAPEVFGPLKQAIAIDRPEAFTYPGSPLLAADALRRQDRLTACELRPGEAAELKVALAGFGPSARVLQADGFRELPGLVRSGGRALILIDPPYERGDDYDRTVGSVATSLSLAPETVLVVWAPLKDLETLDRLVRELEALRPGRGFVGEVRLRPPLDPLRLNGCALVVLNGPEGLEACVEAACVWTAEALGEPGGRGRVWLMRP